MLNKKLLIDLTKFVQLIKINEDGFEDVYLIEEKETDHKFAASITKEIILYNSPEIIFISNEINFSAGMNHPSILKFIGYSPTNFLQENRFVVMNEYCRNGYLQNFMNDHDTYFKIFDDTKKLILIFGIASGMNYLHHNNILHCDLKPNNIAIDEHFFPKIYNFYLSESMPIESIDCA